MKRPLRLLVRTAGQGELIILHFEHNRIGHGGGKLALRPGDLHGSRFLFYCYPLRQSDGAFSNS